MFSDSPDGATANAMYPTIVEMAKAYDLNLYEYLKFLLEHRPNENMTDEELDYLAPWSIDVQEQCSIKKSKMLVFQNPSNGVLEVWFCRAFRRLLTYFYPEVTVEKMSAYQQNNKKEII